MNSNSLYTYISAGQAVELDVCMRHPALELEGLSFVGFVSSSDNELADLFVRHLQNSLRYPVKEIRDKRALGMAYRQGNEKAIYVIRCDSFDADELTHSVYPAMMIYRDFIFDHHLKHFYVGDKYFIESATHFMPDLFVVNNVVLQLTNYRRLIEDDIASGKMLAGKMRIPDDTLKIDLTQWLGQRAFNAKDGKGKIMKLNKLRAKSGFYAKSFIYTDLSSLYIISGRFPEAMECLRKAEKYSGQIGNRNFRLKIILQKSLLYAFERKWKLSEEENLLLTGQLVEGDSVSLAISAYNLLAYCLIRQHRLEDAADAVQQAFLESGNNGDTLARATSISFLGDIAVCQSAYSEARRQYRASLSLYASRSRLPQVALNLLRLGDTFRAVGETRFARMYFQAALELYTHLELNYGKALSLRGLALVDLALDRGGMAITNLRTATKLFGCERSPYDQAYSKVYLGECFLSEEQVQEAERLLEEASEVLHGYGEREEMFLSRLKGIILLRTGVYDKAAEYLENVLSYSWRIGDKANVISTLIYIGEIYYYRKDFTKSLSSLKEALDLSCEYQFVRSRMRIYQLLVKVYEGLEDREYAEKYTKRFQRIQALLQLLYELDE